MERTVIFKEHRVQLLNQFTFIAIMIALNNIYIIIYTSMYLHKMIKKKNKIKTYTCIANLYVTDELIFNTCPT